MTIKQWHLENIDCEYRDYALDMPDINGCGGYIRLTIDTKQRSAGISIMIDNDEGDRFLEKDFSIPLPWALAVARGIDGFTLTEEDNA